MNIVYDKSYRVGRLTLTYVYGNFLINFSLTSVTTIGYLQPQIILTDLG